MTLELFQYLGFEVCIAEYVDDLEDAIERGAAVPDRFPVNMMAGLAEQILQPHECADTLVERVFVEYFFLVRPGLV